MQSFQFSRSGDLQSAYSAYRTADAEAADAAHSHSQYLAGGTTLLDLMKLGVMRPERVVDINDLDRTNAGLVEFAGNRLQLGALTRMSDVSDHPDVRREFPVIAQSLQLAASAQIRNMASLGGNVLQRTAAVIFAIHRIPIATSASPARDARLSTGSIAPTRSWAPANGASRPIQAISHRP